MNEHTSFDRLLGTWLREEGAPGTLDYLEDVLRETAATRQRSVWSSPWRWLPMDVTIPARAVRVPAADRYLLLLALLVALLVAAVAFVAGQQRRLPPPFGPAANGQIAFDADGLLILANADGSARTTLAVNRTAASAPVFSPDGTRIAFYAAGEGAAASDALHVANADGSDVRAVSVGVEFTASTAVRPSWSPDASRIVFGAAVDGVDRLVVANSDGSGATVLGPSDAAGWTFPAWSPDGRLIAFAAYASGGTPPTVQVVNPDGTGPRVLVTAPGPAAVIQDLQWAPDTTGRLAFVIGPDRESANRLTVVDVGTGAAQTISERPNVVALGLSWSPDASRIASNHSDVGSFVVNADGSGFRVLADARCAGRVIWSPDGTRLLCLHSVALGEGRFELLVVDVDGGRPVEHISLGGAARGDAAAEFSWQRLAP